MKMVCRDANTQAIVDFNKTSIVLVHYWYLYTDKQIGMNHK